MRNLTLFLDDGGVMNNNELRGAEWRRLLGEFFPPRLGGLAEHWAEANRRSFGALWERFFEDQARFGLVDGYFEWSRAYQLEWLRSMAAEAGAEAPQDDDSALALAVAAARFVTSNCKSSYPDAPPAIRTLAAAEFRLCTASGEESAELHGYLTGMGVRGHFSDLFGPDLVNAFKLGPAYYERAFVAAGVEPGFSVVVDDSPEALSWAAAARAITVLVDRNGTGGHGAGISVRDLSELPAVAEMLEASIR